MNAIVNDDALGPEPDPGFEPRIRPEQVTDGASEAEASPASRLAAMLRWLGTAGASLHHWVGFAALAYR